MNIHKKALSLVLAVSLVVGAFSGTAAFAASAKTITVGDGGSYSTLDSAIQVADSGDTIKLVSNLSVDHSVAIDKAVTIEGNGKTILVNEDEDCSSGDYESDDPNTYSIDTPSKALEVAADGVTLRNFTLTSGEGIVGVSDFQAGIFINSKKNVVLQNLSFLRYSDQGGMAFDPEADYGCTAADVYVNGNSTVTVRGTLTSTQWHAQKPVIYVRPPKSDEDGSKNLTLASGADVKLIRNGESEDPMTSSSGYALADDTLLVPAILVEMPASYSKAQTADAVNTANEYVSLGGKWEPSFIPAVSSSEVGYVNDHLLYSTVVAPSRIKDPDNDLQDGTVGLGKDLDSTASLDQSEVSWTSGDQSILKDDPSNTDDSTQGFIFLKKGNVTLSVQSTLTAGWGDDINSYWAEGDTWDFSGKIAVTVGDSGTTPGGSSDAGSVSSAIDDLSESSNSSEVADVISQVLGLSSAEQCKLAADEIQKLEGLLLSASEGKIARSIPAPVTGEFKDSGALPEVPTATGLLLAAGVTGDESDPVTVTLATTQEPAVSGSLLTIDFTLTKQVGSDPAETLHTTLAFPVTVSIRLPANFVKQSTYTYVVSHALADGSGKTTILPVTISGTAGNYTATFTTDSFSTFSIVGTYKGSSSGGSGSHHSSGGSSSSSSSGSSATGTSTAATFVSDTNQDFSVNSAYQFKITSKNGAAPSLVVGTPGVFETQLVSTSGNDYFFKLTAVGKPGDKAGIYVNGVKLLVATVGTTASVVKSDTTGQFKVSKGKTYLFKLTADSKPSLVPGNSSVFQVTLVKQTGKDYFYQATAVGKAGQATGFYINSGKTPVAVATIA